MSEWWKGRLASFDLEATGVEPTECRIVSASLAMCGGGFKTEVESWLVNPGVVIPDEAIEIHGITNEKMKADGLKPKAAITEILWLLEEALQMSAGILIITNARYDLTLLKAECLRHKIDWPFAEDAILVLDPFVIDKFLDRYRKGSRKLEALCQHYGAVLAGAHDAEHDAVAAARLVWAIGAKGQAVRKAWNAETGREKAAAIAEWEACRHDPRLLYVQQKKWAREQAIGLRDYFEKQGEHEKAKSVSELWPIEI